MKKNSPDQFDPRNNLKPKIDPRQLNIKLDLSHLEISSSIRALMAAALNPVSSYEPDKTRFLQALERFPISDFLNLITEYSKLLRKIPPELAQNFSAQTSELTDFIDSKQLKSKPHQSLDSLDATTSTQIDQIMKAASLDSNLAKILKILVAVTEGYVADISAELWVFIYQKISKIIEQIKIDLKVSALVEECLSIISKNLPLTEDEYYSVIDSTFWQNQTEGSTAYECTFSTPYGIELGIKTSRNSKGQILDLKIFEIEP